MTVDSAAAGTSNVAVTKTGATSKAVIEYDAFPTPGLRVEVAAVCDQQDPLTLWTIRVKHPAGWRVKTVRFPQVLAVPAIGEGGDDCLVLPALSGTLIENPAKNWRDGFGVTLKYPGNLSAQFLVYQDPLAGLYLAGCGGHPMSLGVSKRAEGFHVREYYAKRWCRGYPGAVGIPLFSYLYHEFAIGYGGDSAGLSPANSRWNVRCHAVNLVAGRIPGGSVWSSPQNMLDAHPDQIAMSRSHCRLLKTRAKDFLMLGTMLHPLELTVRPVEVTIPVRRGGQWVKESVPTPAILTSSWQSPDSRIGHLFVNVAETPQPLNVELDTRNAPAGASYDGQVWRSGDDGGFRHLWHGQRLPKDFSAELKPGEVVFVELRG